MNEKMSINDSDVGFFEVKCKPELSFFYKINKNQPSNSTNF